MLTFFITQLILTLQWKTGENLLSNANSPILLDIDGIDILVEELLNSVTPDLNAEPSLNSVTLTSKANQSRNTPNSNKDQSHDVITPYSRAAIEHTSTFDNVSVVRQPRRSLTPEPEGSSPQVRIRSTSEPPSPMKKASQSHLQQILIEYYVFPTKSLTDPRKKANKECFPSVITHPLWLAMKKDKEEAKEKERDKILRLEKRELARKKKENLITSKKRKSEIDESKEPEPKRPKPKELKPKPKGQKPKKPASKEPKLPLKATNRVPKKKFVGFSCVYFFISRMLTFMCPFVHRAVKRALLVDFDSDSDFEEDNPMCTVVWNYSSVDLER